jgi:hypothetical protein
VAGVEPQLGPLGSFQVPGCIGGGQRPALLGFQYKTAAFAEVIAACIFEGAVHKLHRPLHHVGIVGGVIGGRVWAGYADEVIEVQQKEALVGVFGAAGSFPAVFKVREISKTEVTVRQETGYIGKVAKKY